MRGRWIAVGAACALVVLVLSVGAWWAYGGDELTVGLNTSAVMEADETYYFGVALLTPGTAKVRSAEIRSVTGTAPEGVAVDLLAVRRSAGQSGIGVQNGIDRHNEIPVDAVRIDDGGDDLAPRDHLVVEVAPRQLGVWRIADLELEYQSGWHRPRVATSTGKLCVLVVAPGTRMRSDDGSAPEGVDPDDWQEYRDCLDGW